jgi:hypothetical protein
VCVAGGETLVEILDGAEPLSADIVWILGAHIATWFDETSDLAIVVDLDDLTGVAEDGTGIVSDNVNLGHGMILSSNEHAICESDVK